MDEEQRTFQPDWEERKKHHHHHHSSHRNSENRTNTWGGWLKLHDKQAYYGMMCIVLALLGYGAYRLVMMFVDEWRAMPHDDPTTEMKVDELRIRKVDEQTALLTADSIAKEYNIDSLQKRVQIDTRPVYRPPKKDENKWYITQREWKSIFVDYKRWKYERRLAKELRKREREERREAKRRAREEKKRKAEE